MTLKEQITEFKAVRLRELQEAREWINNGDKNAVWHWAGKEQQGQSLEGGCQYFFIQYPNKGDQTEDNILRFCGQEVYDLWNGYNDDNIQSWQNHCAALYAYIKKKCDINACKVGDIVPYRNRRGNIKQAEITSFKTVDNGKIWFNGIDTVTKAKVWYPVHISEKLKLSE